VTRKITRAAARIALGLQDQLYLGNLDAKRDWGHARDYVRAQWLVLQQEQPDDYVIATGEQHSVKEFCEKAFRELGVHLEWRGQGVSQQGIVTAVEPNVLLERHARFSPHKSSLETGKVVVQVDPRYFRPTEVETLLGDASKARQQLGWQPEVSFDTLVQEMIHQDLCETARQLICQRNGFTVPASCEAHM
jgi:GDPmannose 4,6-dehydratase